MLVQRALDGVHGVDVNPYAIAIARFRLLLAALKECGITRLSDAPGFEIHLACGDSLLHGSVRKIQQMFDVADELKHVYQPEDPEALSRLLKPGSYHAVVANPPYITPKDLVAECGVSGSIRNVPHDSILWRCRSWNGSSRSRRRWFHRADHSEQLHEARVWQETDRGVLPDCRAHPRHRHERGRYIRPWNLDRNPVSRGTDRQ